MIAFLAGFSSVFVCLAAWTLWGNPDLVRSNWLNDPSLGESQFWHLAVFGATLIAGPLAGAWIGMELVARLRPLRAMDARVQQGNRLAAAGAAAAVLSAVGSSVVFAFAPEWLPEAIVTGTLSMLFSAVALLPFARRRVGHCIHCGYDLRGGALRATCPECGAVGSAV